MPKLEEGVSSTSRKDLGEVHLPLRRVSGGRTATRVETGRCRILHVPPAWRRVAPGASQCKNKEKAMALLMAKAAGDRRSSGPRRIADIRGRNRRGAWGNQIRKL